MKSKFKFFRGYVGTLDLMDGQTYATASLYNPNGIRVDVNANPLSNNEMERYYAEHFQRVERLDRDVNEQIRLFQATTTITVNPTLWTKVKIFGTRVKLVLIETWKLEPIGVVVVTLLVSVVTFIGVMKLFGA
jgi:hypothetical protein